MSTLSWSTRIKGFCICFAVGIVFSLMGALVLMLHLGMARFAIFYTLGNIVSMARYTQRSVYIFGYWLSGHNFSLDFFSSQQQTSIKRIFPVQKIWFNFFPTKLNNKSRDCFRLNKLNHVWSRTVAEMEKFPWNRILNRKCSAGLFWIDEMARNKSEKFKFFVLRKLLLQN